MVFLRLVVKVYPREQLPQPPSTSKFSSFRNLLPDTSSNNGSSATPNLPPGTPVSFLLALSDPEETTLGQLASLIQSKWKKLRPHAEPLDIKKLLDDSRDSVDLDIDLTVADVFVNKARARRDEDDQSGTVRVIQRPAAYAPVRFPSVDQDWDAAVGQVEGERRAKKAAADKERFSPIEEGEDEESSGEEEEDDDEEEEEDDEEVESGKKNLIDRQAKEVEAEEEEEDDEGVSEEEESEEDDNKQPNGHAEEEAGDESESEEEQIQDNDVTMEDSLPGTRVLKRKMSQEDIEPKKQPRLEQPNHVAQENRDNAEKANGSPLSSPLGARKRDGDRAPSFSGLGRRLSFGERPALSNGLGLGITKSPPRKKFTLMANTDLFQDSTHPEPVPNDSRLSPTSLPPSSAATVRRGSINQPSTPAKLQAPADKVRQLQSALRKDSPAERTPERRSVSFAEGEDLVISTSAPTSVPPPKLATRTITKENKDVSSGDRRLFDTSSGAPVSQEEDGQTEDEESDEEEVSGKVNHQTNEFEEKLKAKNPDPKSDYARKLKFASRKWDTMKRNETATRKRDKERYIKVVQELKEMKAEIVEIEESMKPPSQRRKAQTPKPNGTSAPRKLSRPEPMGSSQSQRSEEPWDIEIPTPRPNSKKLIMKEPPSSQSRKSQEREQEEEKEHWDIDIPTPKANGAPLRRPDPKKSSQEKLPPPPEESESDEESSSEEESIAQSKPSVVIKSPPKAEDSKLTPKPASNPEPEPETESESEESEADEKEEEEEEEEKAAPISEAKPTPKTESRPESDSGSEEEETESESDEEPESHNQQNPNTETDSSSSSSEEDDDDDDNDYEKENQNPTRTTKDNFLRRTSLNLPSSQPNPQPTSSQSTPTGRPVRPTLKSLLQKQREEQSEKARLKAEADKAQRQRQQPSRDIFSGPSDSEESEDESESESDSGADAGDILSSGRVGRLRTALRK
jgi:hypothetical protein